MESLNDIVEEYIKMNTPKHNGEYRRKIEIERDFDKNLPKIYELEIQSENKAYQNIFKAIGQLDLEYTDAEPNRVLFQTKLDKSLQKLMIYHDGRKIPGESLNWSNKWLNRIAKDRVDWNQNRHGNLIAGQMLKSLGGNIHLENLINNRYNVKTTIEIPL